MDQEIHREGLLACCDGTRIYATVSSGTQGKNEAKQGAQRGVLLPVRPVGTEF